MNKKKNPNRIPLTMADIKKYQKLMDEEWHKKEKELYLCSAQWASIFYQAICYFILCRDFGFKPDDLTKLQDNMGEIANKVTYTDYTLEDVMKECNQYGVELDPEELKNVRWWDEEPNDTL